MSGRYCNYMIKFSITRNTEWHCIPAVKLPCKGLAIHHLHVCTWGRSRRAQVENSWVCPAFDIIAWRCCRWSSCSRLSYQKHCQNNQATKQNPKAHRNIVSLLSCDRSVHHSPACTQPVECGVDTTAGQSRHRCLSETLEMERETDWGAPPF